MYQQKKVAIKKHILKVFSQLQMVRIINNHYRLIKKSLKIQQVDTLTHLLAGQANKIYFYENILYG